MDREDLMTKPTDHELDLSVAGMLRFGVTLAALVVLAGGVLYLRHPWRHLRSYAHFQMGDPSLRSIGGVFRGAFHLEPRHMIQLGLLLLIATPVARVVYCVIGFARQRDRLYVAVSATVLAVLLYSLTKAIR
jgi:uncharacterized membrane protein